MTEAPEKRDRPEIFYELTKSICPECRRDVDARILLRDGKVIMRKRCPDHGWFEALVFGDADLYTKIQRFNKPGTLPLKFATEIRDGCPRDCGLCPDHQQHTCLALIEVNSGCNLDCPLCFANSGTHLAKTGFELTYDQVDFMLARLVEAEGTPEVVQFSGGEPTLHPRLLDFIALAQEKGIEYVMVNTNGVRLAHDDRLLEGFARLRPHVYLQFDGFDATTNLALRGRADLIDEKLRTLDRLASADVRVVLVAAVERGVNEHEIGRIVEFGLRHPAVFGVNFQPAFRAQRHVRPADPLERITIPDVLKALEEQTSSLFKLSDFVPVPCCMPTCNFVTYALLDGDEVMPITRMVDVETALDYVKNRTVPAVSDELVRVLERLWSSSAQIGSDTAASDVHRSLVAGRAAERCTACRTSLPLSAHVPRDLARHVFMVNTRDFMDPWTFNVKNVMKCCVEFLIPDGRMIPFCAYNSVGYREQVVSALNAAASRDRIATGAPQSGS
ncbi:MAG TPA: radical SAM protein [Candidatus Limnocylindria bacterium]|nr:radical SAM protein [Candidatus Limnocylindria bacterium]